MIHFLLDDEEGQTQRGTRRKDVSDAIRRLLASGFKIYSSWLGEFVVESMDGVTHWCKDTHALLKLASSR